MKVAVLDAVGIYLGQREIEDEAFDPEIHIDAKEYGGDCDIVVGPKMPLYRWDRELKRFEPVHSHQEEFARDMQKVIEFAARQAAGVSARPVDNEDFDEMDALIKKHFPSEHRKVRE